MSLMEIFDMNIAMKALLLLETDKRESRAKKIQQEQSRSTLYDYMTLYDT